MPDTSEKFYTAREAAVICRVSEQTVRRKIAAYVPKNDRYQARRKIDGVKQLVNVLTENGMQKLVNAINAEHVGIPVSAARERNVLFNRNRTIRTIDRLLEQLSNGDLRLVEHLTKRLAKSAD